MNLQLTLENELVRIRPLNNQDLESLYQVAKDPEIWKQHPYKRYLRVEFEEFFTKSIKSKGALAIIEKTTNKIIGSSRFKNIDGFPNGVEIGWTFIGRKYWGGKYNMEIKNLMINHAFEHVDNVIFYVDKNNIRSQKAVKKINGQKISASEYGKLPRVSSDNETFIIKKPNRLS